MYIMKVSIILIIVIFQSVSTVGELIASFEPDDVIFVIEGQTESLEMNLTGFDRNLLLEAESSATDIFKIDTNDSVPFQIKLEFVQNVSGHSLYIPVTGVALGVAEITFTAKDNSGRTLPDYQIPPYTVKVNKTYSIIETIYRYTIQVWLILAYVAMGVKMEWKVIRVRLRRPWAIFIGALCQFIIMPLLSFSIAKLLKLDSASAIGLITVGSSPGGWLSNMFSLLLDLDLVLSLTMTFCSTVLALGFMPLNSFIYSREFIDGNKALAIPFKEIIIQLSSLIAPVIVGMFILHKWPKVARMIRLVLKPFVIAMIATAFGLGLPLNLYAFLAPIEIYMSALILPFVGGILGLLCSKLACLCNKSAMTVAFETGSQNLLIATNVIYMSYPRPEADLMRRFPTLVFVTTLFQSLTLMLIVKVMQRFPGTPYEDDMEEDNVSNKSEAVDGDQLDNIKESDQTPERGSLQDDPCKQKTDSIAVSNIAFDSEDL